MGIVSRIILAFPYVGFLALLANLHKMVMNALDVCKDTYCKEASASQTSVVLQPSSANSAL